MLWFTIIILLISPLLINLYNQINNNKISVFFGILTVFFFLTIFTVPVILTTDTSFLGLQIIVYIILFLFFSAIIAKSYLNWKKDNYKKLLLSSFYKPFVYVAVLVPILIFIMFYSSNNFDATFYIQISTNFLESVFSTNGIENSNQFQLYLGSSMYYVYPVLFPTDITASYYILNPLIFSIFVVSIIDEFLIFSKLKNNWIHCIIVIVASISISITNVLFSIGGNLDIHMLTIFMIIIGFLKNEDLSNNKYNHYVIPLAMIFFSPTGLILSLPFTIGIWIYMCIKNRDLFATLSAVFVIYNFCLSLFVFVLKSNSLITLLLFVPTALLLIYHAAILKLKNYTFKSKGIQISHYIYDSIIPAIALILVVVYYALYMYKGTVTEIYGVIFFSVAFLFLVVLNLLTSKDSENKVKIQNFLLLVVIFSVISVPYHWISETLFHTESNWRLTFMLIGTARPYIFLMSLLFIVSMIDYADLVFFYNKLTFINTIQTKINSISGKRYISAFSFDIILISITAVTLGQYAANFDFDQSYYAKNGITKADRYFVESIDFMDYSKSYVIDVPINEYLAGGVNISEYLLFYLQNDAIWNVPHVINYFGYDMGVEMWASENDYKGDTSINYLFQNLFDNLENPNDAREIRSVTQKWIKHADYISISKNKDYYVPFSDFLGTKFGEYEHVYDGELISFWKYIGN